MTLLAVRVTSTAVHAAVSRAAEGDAEEDAGSTSAALTLRHHLPAADRTELSAEELWQGTLAAVGEALAALPAGTRPDQVGVAGDPHTLVLWDRETLGSPRPVLAAGDRRTTALCEQLRAEGTAARAETLADQPLDHRVAAPRLRWLAEHEPHTWALVTEGRYAVGGVESYLVARMTRGLEHLTDRAHARPTLLLGDEDWSPELCALFGVPLDALPEVVEPSGRPGAWGTTDPRTFLGLRLPLHALSPA